MSIIDAAFARKVLDSRGNPTIEVEIHTDNNAVGIAIAPSGASKGSNEVKDYPPRGIDESLKIFKEKVAPELIGQDVFNQKYIDHILHTIDGTTNFSNIGGNLAIATSISVAKAAANDIGMPLHRYLGGHVSIRMPIPVANIIGGGKHAINGTTIQEFLVISHGKKVSESIFINAEIHKAVGKKLRDKFPNISIGVGDERAWVAPLNDEEALKILKSVIDDFRSRYDIEIFPGLDVAATSFFSNGKYIYKGKELEKDEQIEFMENLVDEYEIKYLEDPLEENDFEGFSKLTRLVGSKTLVVGDDLFVTNPDRLMKGIESDSANAILLKPNQIGTLTDFIKTTKIAKEAAYTTIVSHRSGETEDNALAEIAVGVGGEYIKTGAIGGERTSKLNQLIRIEEYMED